MSAEQFTQDREDRVAYRDAMLAWQRATREVWDQAELRGRHTILRLAWELEEADDDV